MLWASTVNRTKGPFYYNLTKPKHHFPARNKDRYCPLLNTLALILFFPGNSRRVWIPSYLKPAPSRPRSGEGGDRLTGGPLGRLDLRARLKQ